MHVMSLRLRFLAAAKVSSVIHQCKETACRLRAKFTVILNSLSTLY